MSPAGANVAAVVPVFGGATLLPACVAALLGADDALEVLLVDDGSRDDSVAVAEALAAGSGGRVGVLALGANHGFAGAVNRGVELLLRRPSPPEVVVLVNQDCVVRPGFVAPLVRVLGDRRVAAAGARLLDADGVTLQHAGARVEANGLTTHVGRGSRDPSSARELADCDYVCGALMALRTEAWRRFGPFDEGYRPAYFEEADFCAKARAAGLRIVYVPDSEAVHAEASCSTPREFLRRYHRSRLRFVVRRMWPQAGFLRWLRAEAAWLLTLRRAADLAPVLAAYARVPGLLREAALERRRPARPRAAGTLPRAAATRPRAAQIQPRGAAAAPVEALQ
jgi:GT2 family glycosyltransferase